MREFHTLGSLFDGIGAFPYAASFFGIKAVWASEILPNPVSITKRHFPEMEHLGDITKLDGSKIPPVDIICFGSPCQSFSVAGPRTSFNGKSGLFFEAIRIIREMRLATNGEYPKISVFENVPGVLSIDGGRSYKTIIESFAESEIPMPESGKWADAGMVRGGSVDFAWVCKDSQHYGVAQRRKRLFAVADFTGRRAAEILFESKSLRGYFAARERARQGTAPDAESGAGSAGTGCIAGAFMAGQAKNARSIAYSESVSPTLKGSASGLNQTPSVLCVATGQADALSAVGENLSPTLTINHEAPYICGEQTAYGICSHSSNSMKGPNPNSGIYEAETCKTLDTTCLNPACQQGGVCVVEPQIARTLTARHDSSPCADRGQNIVAFAQNQRDEIRDLNDLAGCLAAEPGMKQQTYVVQPDSSSAFGFDLQQITSKTNRSTLKEVQPSLCSAGNPHVVEVHAGTDKPAPNCLTPWDKQQIRIHTPEGLSPTLAGADGSGGRNPAGVVMAEVHPGVSGTLLASGAGTSRPAGMCGETDLAVAYCLQGSMIGRADENGPQGDGVNTEIAYTLNTIDRHSVAYGEMNYSEYKECHIPVLKASGGALGGGSEMLVASVDCRNLHENPEMSGVLAAKETGGYSLNFVNPVRTGYVIRRLTPTECERLMGFDDGYTAVGYDGKLMSDSARYQMLGNSIVTNVLAYIMQNISEQLNKEKNFK